MLLSLWQALLDARVLPVIAVLLIAWWTGRVLEARLLAAHSLDMTLRVMLTKLLRAVLVLFALLVALPALGIDLTALSVFGGALGVGLGFGLQKIASNYISGFIILFDRSVKIGDQVSVDSRAGEVTAMTSRYVVVRSLDGAEAIIPNETMITSTVVNHSYSDRKVCVTIPVQISYRSDLDAATQVLIEAARASACTAGTGTRRADLGVGRKRHLSRTRRMDQRPGARQSPIALGHLPRHVAGVPGQEHRNPVSAARCEAAGRGRFAARRWRTRSRLKISYVKQSINTYTQGPEKVQFGARK